MKPHEFIFDLMMGRLLGNLNITVQNKDSLVVQRGQRNSLLCSVPNMGSCEFSQLLKNAALYSRSIRATLPSQSFKQENHSHGKWLDAVVDRYALYQPLLDRVINDPIDSLVLVFFPLTMTLAACMKMTPEQ